MRSSQLRHAFSNIGFRGAGRAFPGFPEKSEAFTYRLEPREARRFDLISGDIFSVHPSRSGGDIFLLVFDENGRIAPELIGLDLTVPVLVEQFNNAPLVGWMASQGGATDLALHASQIATDELLVLRAKSNCTLWAICPQMASQLVSSAAGERVSVSLKPAASKNGPLLPPPLGHIRDEFIVPRGSGKAYELAPGEVVQIIDIEGQQCSDFMALRTDGLERGQELEIDTTATRSMVRGAYPGPGLLDKFFDRNLNPMMRVVQDTCGQHDAFGMACTARGYEDRGFPGHLNCSDNISGALDPYGVAARPAWPAINFFWRSWIDPHTHQMMTEESHSRPGDYVALEAMEQLVCVSTACPDDIDPINGWNPTDVHVRIYKAGETIQRAVAWREKEDAPMSISQESAFHPATSKLTNHFAPARDLWAPVSFPSIGTVGEYWACREKVTLQDMSALRKFDVIGPDAERLLQRAMTRDISRIAVFRGTYALICDEMGGVVDDGTLFRLAPELFRWCCGSEESGRVLEQIATQEGLQVRIHALDGALPNLALQGPKSRDVLREIVFTQPTHPSLDQLKWFGVTIARLNDRDGIPFMLSRSGYTGELGYELFCAKSDAVALWEAVMEAGAPYGIAPMGNDALDIIRIEAGLAGANEFAPGVDAHEAGLGFAISPGKNGFIGETALARNAALPRRVLRGLKLNCNDLPAHGAHIYLGERQVGTVTSATRSPMFDCAIAMAVLAVEKSEPGTELEVGLMDGHMKRVKAIVCETPFFDPKRERARA